MEKVKTLERTQVQIGEYIICFIAFTIPISIELNGLSIILLVLFGFTYLKNFKELEITNQKALFLIIGLFLIFVPTLLYTSNLNKGVDILLKKISIFLIPLILCFVKIDNKLFAKACACFVLSCFISTVICWFYFYHTHWQFNPLYLILKQDHFRGNFVPAINISPTYLSLFLIFSIFILFQFLIKSNLSFAKRSVIYFLILYFIINTILLTSRMPILAFCFIVLSFSFVYFFNNRAYFKIVIILFFIIGTGYFLFNSSWLNHRFIEVINTQLNPPTGTNHNSTNLRVAILNCSLEGLKTNWLFGIGVGDLQAFLNSCYLEKGYSDVLYKNKLNVHNIYLDMWLTTGIFGLILLLVSFIYFFIHSVRKQDYLYTAFLLLFIIIGFTEALFNTQRGIVFYAFFSSLFAMRNGLFSGKVSVNKGIGT